MRSGPRLPQAQAYCRRLARTHYENFTVASWLLPRKLRQHFANIYAYCRWSDDLADETAGGAESLQLLDWWQSQLDDCYRGIATHPVFVALQSTIDEFDIPIDPFRDLLIAFRQDQTQTRYETFDDLLGYCRNSANPVGRLVLYLGRCHDDRRGQLADNICTALQLANFWQDVARDYDRGRIYLPQESCRRAGYDEAMFARREFNPQFRQLLAGEVDRAESLFARRPTAGRTHAPPHANRRATIHRRRPRHSQRHPPPRLQRLAHAARSSPKPPNSPSSSAPGGTPEP